MKNIKFVLGLISVVLVLASCVTTQNAMDDDMVDPRSQQVGNRLYVQDPFYGTVVLERDPYTGRYYDVTFGGRPGFGYYNRNMYGAVPNRVITNRVVTDRGTIDNRRNVIVQQPPRRQEIPTNREEVRRKVLGDN
jgi:hypothetical protein